MTRFTQILGCLSLLASAFPASADKPAKAIYQMTFVGYSADLLQGIDEYIVEFPGYGAHRVVREDTEWWQYEYESSETPEGLASHLQRMLVYLSLSGTIEVAGTHVVVRHPDYAEISPEPETRQATLQDEDPDSPPSAKTPNITLRLTTDRGDTPSFNIGENLNLTVELNLDAWLYCYYRQVDGSIVKFFPNPFHRDARVEGGAVQKIPGDLYPFELKFTEPPGDEMLNCYATERDVRADLPVELREPDFSTLSPALNLQIDELFSNLRNTGIARASLPITVRR